MEELPWTVLEDVAFYLYPVNDIRTRIYWTSKHAPMSFFSISPPAASPTRGFAMATAL